MGKKEEKKHERESEREREGERERERREVAPAELPFTDSFLSHPQSMRVGSKSEKSVLVLICVSERERVLYGVLARTMQPTHAATRGTGKKYPESQAAGRSLARSKMTF